MIDIFVYHKKDVIVFYTLVSFNGICANNIFRHALSIESPIFICNMLFLLNILFSVVENG